MNEKNSNRNKWIHVRLNPEELKKINAGFARSTQRKRSEYVRKILLGKPITVYSRNQSFDDFVAEMILLRRELNAIGNNFNQAVKKLHSIDTDPEIKTWALINEHSKQMFIRKIAEINLKIAQISDRWLQE